MITLLASPLCSPAPARLVRGLLFALSTTLLPPSPASAQTEAADLRADLAEVRALADERKWKEADERLTAALEAAADDPETPLYWGEIQDLLERIAFWSQFDEPQPEDVLYGELVRWKPRSGDLKIRYTRDRLAETKRRDPLTDEEWAGDFLSSFSALYFPPLFVGEYSVEFSGDELRSLPEAHVEWRWDRATGNANGVSYAVDFGRKTTAQRSRGEKYVVVDECDVEPRLGRPYSFEVKVSKSRISGSYNGKTLVRCDREKGDFGQLSLSHAGGEEIVIEGKIDPGWIEGLIDERIQLGFDEFLTTYDVLAKVPARLRRRLEGERPGLEGGNPYAVFPEPDAEPNKAVFQQWLALAEADEPDEEQLREKYRKWLHGLDLKALTEPAGIWFASLTLIEAERWDLVIQLLEQLTEMRPDFFEAAWLLMELESEDWTLDEAREQLRELARRFPDYILPWEQLAELELLEGRRQAAREVVREALETGLSPIGLRRILTTLARAEHGPSFRAPAVVMGPNYRVVTDLGERTARQALNVLEESWRRYNTRIRRVRGEADQRMPVYLLSGRAGFAHYCEDLLGDPAENALGLYSSTLKQLVVLNGTDSSMTDRTLRHEGFHQYFDRLVGDSPIWLNEGYAELVERARFVNGAWSTAETNADHLEVLKSGRWTPLEAFVFISPREFLADGALHYAQAWALVHMLDNGDRDDRAILRTLLEELEEGRSNRHAVAAAFEGVDWDAIERKFRSYVRELR